MRTLKQSHSAEKLKRGGPLGVLKVQFAAIYKKLEGVLWRQCRKNLRGGPYSLVGFVSYVKNEINERGPFALT